MELFKKTQTDKRKTLIALIKQNAPHIYQKSVLAKKFKYEQELNNLREVYKNETDEQKRQSIISHAREIKSELEVYSV